MTTEINEQVNLTLEESVAEVLGLLTGLDLTYDPQLDRFRSITRALNRALRNVALEHEWSYYADDGDAGLSVLGQRDVQLSATWRPRSKGDDAVRLVAGDGGPRVWAYFLPRDALHKYAGRAGLWVAATRGRLNFSRPLEAGEDGLTILVPVMREPVMFRLPDIGTEVPAEILGQPIDFAYPDLVIARAAFLYAQTDPIMQPRVQTLEAEYKDLMYQLVERDENVTDSPYMNEFFVPVQNGITGNGYLGHNHPHADERRWG